MVGSQAWDKSFQPARSARNEHRISLAAHPQNLVRISGAGLSGAGSWPFTYRHNKLGRILQTLYRSALYGFLVGTQTVYFLAALSMAVINLGGSFIAWNDPVLYRQAQQVFCILVTVFLGIKANQARNNTDMVSTF